MHDQNTELVYSNSETMVLSNEIASIHAAADQLSMEQPKTLSAPLQTLDINSIFSAALRGNNLYFNRFTEVMSCELALSIYSSAPELEYHCRHNTKEQG